MYCENKGSNNKTKEGIFGLFSLAFGYGVVSILPLFCPSLFQTLQTGFGVKIASKGK